MDETSFGEILGGSESNSFLFWFCQDYLWWGLLALVAQVIFALRFLWQWIVSERLKESVVPPAFWYFSLAGGLMLATYALFRDPVILVSAAPSVVIYARNIVLIRKGKSNWLMRASLACGVAAIVYGLGQFDTLANWYWTQSKSFWKASDGWGWVAFGFTAQAIFFMRFIWQWVVSERLKRSVLPVGFWYFSLAGGTMISAYALFRDPIILPGQLSGLVVYVRNLVLIKRSKPDLSADLTHRSTEPHAPQPLRRVA